MVRSFLIVALLFIVTVTASWGQFTGGMVRVEGTVEDYDNSFRTGKLYLRNSLTGEDAPVTFLVDKKGLFTIEFPVEWYSFLRAIPLDDPRFIEIEPHIVNTVQYIALADYEDLDASGDPARLVREQIALFDSVYTAVTGRSAGLMSDLVALQQLRAGQLERQGDYSPEQLRAMHRVVCDNIESPLLKEEVWRHYDFMMGQNADGAVLLPEGEATDALRKITDRFKGKPVLLDFWGTACGPCVAAIRGNRPERMRIEQEDKAELVFITSRGWSPDAATYEKFVAENWMPNTVRLSNDDWNIVSSLFNISSVPRYILLDAEGNVVNQNHNGDLKNL